MHQYPNSLVAKVLQARYFRNSSFLNAKIGTNPSFIWRSIRWGRQVINKGARWRIGNDCNVLVYKDNWIPRPVTFKPISPPSLPLETTVAELIDDENKWDEVKLNQHFISADVEEILKIPLPRSQSKDEVLWHFDKRGNYTVKSGYQVTLNIKFPEVPSCSEYSPKRWQALWSLELPEKIKIFFWRAAKNLLPTADNLWKKKCLQEPICQRCRREVETINHALLECKAARKLWIHAPFPFQIHNTTKIDILSTIQDMCSNLKMADVELMIAYCWVVWYARNKFVFENKKIDTRILAAKAEAVVEAYQRVRKIEAGHIHKAGSEKQQKWDPPPENVFKVNVDAAINFKDQVAGLGAVIKDSKGQIVAAGIKQTKLKENVSFAEAEAVELGMQIAKTAAISRLIIETDCQDVAKLVNNTIGNRTTIYWTIEEIQKLMKNFNETKCKYVSRRSNGCAHSLAKFAVGTNTNAIWVGDVPADIMNVLINVD